MRICLLLPLLLLPQDKATRTSDTVRTSDLAFIIDEIAREADRAVERPNDRVLVTWLIDNSTSLKSLRQGELLSGHIARAFAKQKTGVHHSVLSFAEQPQVILKATADPRAAGRAIEWLAAQKPDDTIKNCCANIRAGAAYAGGFTGGKRFLVVFTGPNGDNEDRVEETLKLLRDAGVVLHVIADEAVYSDPYWEALLSSGSGYYGDANRFKKLKFEMKGPDSAYIEFPHGWILTSGDPTYTVPSGFGFWALNRMTAWTGGRYFLYSPAESSQSFCERWQCTVCSGKHKACGAAFDSIKLKITAPSIDSRDLVRERLARDKLTVATYAVWEKLYRWGIVHNSSALRASGGGLTETKPQVGTVLPLGFMSNWKQGRETCKRLVADLDKLIAEFGEAVERLGPEAEKRALATADALQAHMKIMRFNLWQLRAFCEDLEEHERKKHGAEGGGFGSDGLDDT